jgi:hypothetical protein
MHSEPRLVVAGHLAASRGLRQPWQDAQFVPEQFITVSGCLADVIDRPEFWAWHTDRAAVTAEHLPRLVVAFAERDAAELVDELAQQRITELAALLALAGPPPQDAHLRGFEIIGIEYGVTSLHSWLCHSYESAVAEALGIRPDDSGLLADYQQAAAVLEWMDALPADQAPEPVFWIVAAVMELERG